MANEIAIQLNATCTVSGLTTQLNRTTSLNNISGDVYASTIATSTSKVQLAGGGITIANCQYIAAYNLSTTTAQIIAFSYDSGGTDIVVTVLPQASQTYTSGVGAAAGPAVGFTPNQAGAFPYYAALSGTPSMFVVIFGS